VTQEEAAMVHRLIMESMPAGVTRVELWHGGQGALPGASDYYLAVRVHGTKQKLYIRQAGELRAAMDYLPVLAKRAGNRLRARERAMEKQRGEGSPT
jgi:hypothetical protein